MSQYTIVGTSPPRIDIPDKVTGKMTYVHNIRVPGMLHGRVVRPRGQGAYGDGTAPKVLSVDESSIKHIAGAKVVRFGATSSASSRRARVLGDPGGRPAQGEVGRHARRSRAAGNLWKGMRDHGQRRHARRRASR